MQPKSTVAHWGEKKIVHEIINSLCASDKVSIGVGDDAAVVDFPAGKQLVISTDKIPEDLIALQLGLMDPFHHGRYLATVNISDIAAMGGLPLGLLCTLALPDNFSLDYLTSFIRGFVAGGYEWNVPVVGGDTGWGTSVCLSATAFGAIDRGRALRRSGAQVGDRIFATGHLGLFGTALAYFVVARPKGMKISNADESILKERLVQPRARVDAGQFLSASNLCSSCMDVTDGVGQSLRELSIASNARLVIEAHQLPLHSITREVADFLGCSPYRIVFGIGLDLELVGTLRGADLPAPRDFLNFGYVSEGNAGVWLEEDGKISELEFIGWQHFAGSAMDQVRAMYARP